jgi:hypothetical protein
MSQSNSAVYDYVVRELALTEQEPDETPLTIVCEPNEAGSGASIAMRLTASTSHAQALAIASTLQARVRRLCHLQVPQAQQAPQVQQAPEGKAA